jgi:hypothetical protein
MVIKDDSVWSALCRHFQSFATIICSQETNIPCLQSGLQKGENNFVIDAKHNNIAKRIRSHRLSPGDTRRFSHLSFIMSLDLFVAQ